jgi:2-methylaconitate cis-trans-isomerase PrpF
MVGPPASYRLEGTEDLVERGSIDLVSRIISSQKFHKAYAVTGAIATAAAALVRGSTVQGTGRIALGTGLRTIRIGHPTGIIECAVECSAINPETVIERARVTRTARRIMEGSVFVT